FGPVVQLGENDPKSTIKPQFASLLKGQLIETLTLEEALSLFKLPRNIGNYEDKEVVIGVGRFGPYVRHNSKFFSLKKEDDPLTINIERAIELIEDGRRKEREKVIKIFQDELKVQVLNGRWGPYIAHDGLNYKIPKGTDAHSLSYEECLKIIQSQKSSTKPKKFPKKGKK
ncbi:MAG: DNA topoisomerase I, partial [Bacteroidales bacterium]